MEEKITLERLELLKKLGFGDVPDCEPSYTFNTPVLALNTKMVVHGDHSDDIAYIYYAREIVDNEVLEGLFFAPSILEHPHLNHQIYDVGKLLDEINAPLNTMGRYVYVGGFPMIFVEVTEYDWKYNDISSVLGDMFKLIGVTDYFFSKEFNRKVAVVNNY